jgi:hypothetical protein
MPELQPPIPFLRLIREVQWVEVPLIQRDYAQGRESEKEVRNDFLDALHGALTLPAGHARLPLNLDFVYGSIDTANGRRFLPLDGQQRLTTLFLLHWYLAWRDGVLDQFKTTFSDGHHSHFTYRVRPTSTEFFDALVRFAPQGSPDNVQSVRRMLEDEPWFFLHWRLDPTIQSALTMLDAIHERFRGSVGFYARLSDEERPTITFHVLPLEHFGLSDDLYIKMNARGKPLTAFETFKARFEELLKELFPTGTRRIGDSDLPVPQFFERRMDTQWTDFFWRHQHDTFDDAAMNLMLALIRMSLDPANPSFTVDTAALGWSVDPSFTTFHERGWLTERFAIHMMDLLEAWSEGGPGLSRQLPTANYFDEEAFFQRAITAPAGLRYFELVQFAALVFYLRHHRGAVQPSALQEWMRVVTNLAANSDIERPEEFGRSLAGLEKLVPFANQILQRLGEPDLDVLGFSPQQVREESLKAQLLSAHPGWREPILRAEAHGYFQGQIEFLLKFSGVLDRWLDDNSVRWSDSEDAEYRKRFSNYLSKAEAVFSDGGLNDFGDYRWERALLVKGDYLLPRGLNHSLLANGQGEATWKRLLRGALKSDESVEQKRGYVREVFDEIDLVKGVAESLDSVLAVPLSMESWRRAAIEQPEVIAYCWKRNIRWHSDGNIYLMRKVQMNGEHAELFTFHLKVGLLRRKHEKGELAPFGEPRYVPATGEYDPFAYLEWPYGADSIVLAFYSDNHRFLLRTWKGAREPIPDGVRDALVHHAAFSVSADGTEYRQVERNVIETAVDEIVSIARRVPQPTTANGEPDDASPSSEA